MGYLVRPNNSLAIERTPFLGLEIVKLAKNRQIEYQINNEMKIATNPTRILIKEIFPNSTITQ